MGARMKSVKAVLVILLVMAAFSAQADIIITEILCDPMEVSDNYGEWFELYNSGASAVDMTGWTISDDGGQSYTFAAISIEAGEFLVAGISGNMSLNGHVEVDIDYGGFTLDNEYDEIILLDESQVEIDRVEYDNTQGWNVSVGTSMILLDFGTDNNVGSNWGLSSKRWPEGTGDFGTPGELNTDPYSTLDLVISEIMYDPYSSVDNYGEWFEVYNAGPDTANLRLFVFSDNGGQDFLVDEDVFIEPDGYAALVISNNFNLNGGVVGDFDYSGFVLDQTADEIIMTDFENTVVDIVEYDELGSFPTAEGASIYLIDLESDNADGSNWAVATLAWPDSEEDFGSPGYENQDVPPTPQIVVSEILYDPYSSVDNYGEWFELYNAGVEVVNLRLWRFSDNGSNAFRPPNNLFVEPGEYCVLMISTNVGLNGNYAGNYDYTGFVLDNVEDEIFVQDIAGTLIDEVSYNEAEGWPSAFGASIYLTDLGADNSDPAFWSISPNAWPGSFGDFGSPGEENPPVAPIPEIVITEIMYNPTASSDNYGEYFELYNAGSEAVNLRLWEFYDSANDYFFVNTSLFVVPGQYIVLCVSLNTSLNGNVMGDYDYNNFDLDNTSDEIYVKDIRGNLIDEVEYADGGGWPQATGASIYLMSTDSDNNVGANWAISDELWPGSAGDFGSPGAGSGDAGALTLTPVVATVPAGGGNIVYDVNLSVSLPGTFPNVFYRREVILPDESVVVAGIQYFTVTPFMNITLTGLTQGIPGGAPAGTYNFVGYVGYPTVYVTDSFMFEKTGATADGWSEEDFYGDGLGFESTRDAEVVSLALPEEFSIGQAYPNPFNPSTAISLTLPEASDLSIVVYNVNGQQVAEVANGMFSAGNHNLTFDASGMASGLYFMRTIVPGHLTQVQKVMLVR